MEKNFVKRNIEHARKMALRLRALKMASKLRKKNDEKVDS